MPQPRHHESGTPDIREFPANAGSAPARFVAKRRARQDAAGEPREERSIAVVHDNDSAASELLTVLSHQLRTPLQAIFGYTELLEREIHGPLTDAQRRDVRGIQQSQRQLLRLIDTLKTSRQK
ncbi:MAG: histidine kinase dimerization/phospho-acceptor domain-containing protein [Gemmatimonadaceae bacterium]